MLVALEMRYEVRLASRLGPESWPRRVTGVGKR